MMSWTLQHRTPLRVGLACIAVSAVTPFFGPIAFLFIGCPLLAIGLGSVAAAYTNTKD